MREGLLAVGGYAQIKAAATGVKWLKSNEEEAD